MKKLLIVLMTMFAVGMYSCGTTATNEKGSVDSIDSVVDSTVVDSVVDSTIVDSAVIDSVVVDSLRK